MKEFADTMYAVLGGKHVTESQADEDNAALMSPEEACKPHFDLKSACH